MSFGTDDGKFSLAHVVAFQHAIFHPIFSGDGIYHFRNSATSTASPRKALHSFHCPRPKAMTEEIDSTLQVLVKHWLYACRYNRISKTDIRDEADAECYQLNRAYRGWRRRPPDGSAAL
jgi:hypothetical protein